MSVEQMEKELTELSPEQLRQKAVVSDQQAQESFDRCDTDGFVSQWAHGIMADLYRTQADLKEKGNVAEFPALFNLDGSRAPAKLIHAYNKFTCREEEMWMIIDPKTGNQVGRLIRADYKKQSTIESYGYRYGTEKAPAIAKIVGRGHGLSGSAWVAVVRNDRGW